MYLHEHLATMPKGIVIWQPSSHFHYAFSLHLLISRCQLIRLSTFSAYPLSLPVHFSLHPTSPWKNTSILSLFCKSATWLIFPTAHDSILSPSFPKKQTFLIRIWIQCFETMPKLTKKLFASCLTYGLRFTNNHIDHTERI